MALTREKVYLVADKLAEILFYCLIFFIPISTAAIEIFFGFILACFLVRKFIRPDLSFLRNYTNLFLLIFYSFCALSLVNSAGYLKISLTALFFKWGEYILIFLMVEDMMRDNRRMQNCIVILLSVSAIMGIDALSQKFLGVEFIRQRHIIKTDNGLYAVTAAFKHYNAFGVYLVVALSLASAYIIASAGRLKKKLLFILMALALLLGICILLTFSRGSWLGIILSLLLMMFLSRRYALILSVAIFFILAAILINGVRERMFFTFLPGGDADRLTVWKTALSIMKEHPFIGRGIGLFMPYFSAYRTDLIPQYAHNCFLQIWTETGIFSLLSFLVFVWLLLYNGIKRLSEALDPILLGLICGISGFLAHSFFDTDLYSVQLATLFWVLLGLLSAKTAAAR